MKAIQILKKTTHRTEQIKLVISIICLVNGIGLSETDITILSYFVVHGIKPSTDALLINSGITKSGALGNIKTKLYKLGFLKRDKGLYNSYSLNLSEDFSMDDVLNVEIKIDNS